jgi:polyisoprenoid-binding protein YceI
MNRPPAGEWTIDPRHVSAIFRVQHLVVARVRGRFDTIRGTLRVAPRVQDSSLSVVIDAASINTGNPGRDAHLRSPAFLDVARFPELRYAATSVRPAAEPDAWTVEGELTLHGQTRPVELAMTYLGSYEDEGIPLIAFSATAEFDRHDFGITFNRPLAIGGNAIGTRIGVEIELEAIPPDAAAALAAPRH